MWPRKKKWQIILGLVAVGLMAFVVFSVYVATYEADPQDTVFLGQRSLWGDSPAAFRIVVRNHETSRPVEGATVKLTLEGAEEGHKLGEFTTGRDGTLTDSVHIPALPAGAYTLVVESKSRVGKDSMRFSVDIKWPLRLYLTSDKPIYQPGQTIHMRTMALNRMSLKPFAKKPVTFEVEDPKGNKVYRAERHTSDYGIAAADFDLAREVNPGRYRLRITAGGIESEKTVTVKRYVLPKFKVEVATGQPYYLPGQTLDGEVTARYFFGKPVAGAAVEVIGRTIVAEPVEVFRATGATDDTGRFTWRAQLPDHFTGMPLAGGDAFLDIEVNVTDTAGQKVSSSTALAVADQPIRIEAVPECGRLVPNLENLIYIVTSYPDGRPASCRVQVNGQEIVTDESGVGLLRLVPGGRQVWLSLTARDAGGRVGSATLSHECRSKLDFILRTDKAFYSGGETLNVTVLSASDPSDAFFLDVIKDGQTVLTRSLELSDGRGSLALSLPPGIAGTLKLNAYTISPDGESVADSRVVHVRSGLHVAVSADRQEYRPGQTAELEFEVTDADGAPAPAALGLCAVDEAVFHATESRPGLPAQFFLADAELLKPAYQARFFGSPERLLRAGEKQDRLARAAFAAAVRDSNAMADYLTEYIEPWLLERVREDLASGRDAYAGGEEYERVAALLKGMDYTITATTYPEKAARAEAFRRDYFRGLKGLFSLCFLLSMLTVLTIAASVLLLLFCFVRSTLELLRPVSVGLDPARAAVQRALRALTHGCAILVLAPIVLLVGGWIAHAILPVACPWPPRVDDNGFMLMFYLVNKSVVVCIIIMQLLRSAALFRHKETRSLGHSAIGIPLALLSPHVMWLFIGSLANCQWGPLVFLQQMTLIFNVAVLCFAVPLVEAAAVKHRVEIKGVTKGWGYLAITAFLSVVLPMLTLLFCVGMAKAKHTAGTFSTFGQLETARVAYARDHPQADERPSPQPRVRRHFPETLLWQPQLITDDRGRARLSVPLADSITTWRMNVDALSAAGSLGAAEAGIRVFQDFFVDIDLPVALTQNDEISLPVACYNYLKQPQAVRLTLQAGDWCTLQGAAEQTVELQPNEVRAARFRIRARDVGVHKLTVMASGERMSDAVERSIEVKPDGARVERIESGKLTRAVIHEFRIPAEAIAGSERLLLKVHPSTFSEIVEGLENIFRKPYGCFEQTSSCTYPNVLALLYLKRTGRSTPEVEARARSFINDGYQRLLTFEVKGGGFDWFGYPPAKVALTAYGILLFTDMARVHSVDPAVAERAKKLLFSRQRSDDAWSSGRGRLQTTAYVAWALAEAGSSDPEFKDALDYLRAHTDDLKTGYAIALAANALLAHDRRDAVGLELVGLLHSRITRSGDAAFVGSAGTGVMHSRGRYLDIETTALATMAMMKCGRHATTVKEALTWISRQKDAGGTWHSTQATILAMKALLAGTGTPPGQEGTADVQVTVNGRPAGSVAITGRTSDLLHVVNLTEGLQAGANTVRITLESDMELPYQLVGTYWVPWKAAGAPAPGSLGIAVDYDRDRLPVDDTLTCTVAVTERAGRPVPMVIVDLGIPPGFVVDTSAFEAMVQARRLARYEVGGNQCILYVRGLGAGEVLRFSYDLTAQYPLRARIPPSRVYEYYNPENEGVAPSRDITVDDGPGAGQ